VIAAHVPQRRAGTRVVEDSPSVVGRASAGRAAYGLISRGLNPRQQELLAEWEEAGQGQIRRAEYERRFDIAVSTAAKDLQQLVAGRRVRPVGKGPQTLYMYVAASGEPALLDQAEGGVEIEV
jgi:hypothetical protein